MSTPRKPVHPKVAATGATGAATVVIVTIAHAFGLDIPPEVAAAITILIGFAGGYLQRA